MFRPLCAENPLPAARRVYEYLQSLSGKCLTGQMESQWCRSTEHEISYLTDVTGRQPAIRGLDFMDNDYLSVTQRAKDWWARGGIPTICWHTGADFFSGYPECRESELDWASAFVDGTEANRRLLDGLDHAVPYLKRLQSDGVPVLWRPFHEMDGGWFWWGRGGAANFVRLWRLMHDRYTHVHGLRNLIWVLGFSDATEDLRPWYPGGRRGGYSRRRQLQGRCAGGFIPALCRACPDRDADCVPRVRTDSDPCGDECGECPVGVLHGVAHQLADGQQQGEHAGVAAGDLSG